MKKALFVVAVLVAMAGPSIAGEAPEPEGPQYTIFTKLFRGIGNIVKAPVEIPVTMYTVAVDTEVAVGLTFGTIAGVVACVERAVVGVVDIGTFIFPPYDRPILTHTIGNHPSTRGAIDTFPPNDEF